MKKLFIQTAFLSAFFFLFFLAFFSKSVNAVTCNIGGSCSTVGACVSACCKCGTDKRIGPDYSCGGDWCTCARDNNYPPGWQANCGGAPAPAPTAAPAAPSGACSHSLTDAEAQCYLNRYPDLQAAFGNNLTKAKAHWLTYGCKEGRDYSCPTSGQSCGGIGGTDCTTASPRLHDGQHWYCHSLGNTYDCGPCLRCSTTRSDVCGGAPPPPPPPPCSCSTSYGVCNVGCPVGQKQKIVSCNRSGCGEGTWCVADAACDCSFSAWTDVGCGQGGCAVNRMYQTRTVNFPADCPSPLTQCVATSSCASSCTITLTPSPLTVIYGKSAILTANVTPLHAIVSWVDFSSNNPTIVSVNPASVASSPYRTNVYGGKNEVSQAVVTATAVLSPEGSCTTTVPVTVEPAAWFQTQGGDIHAQGSLSDKIPSTATDPNLSLDLNNYPGIISHLPDSQVSFGKGYPSKNTVGNWVASSEYKGKPYGSFQFFKKKFAMQMIEENFNGTLPQADGVYYTKSAKTLSGNWTVPASRWVIILVEGDVTIPKDIKVNKGGFLAIASSGKITFDGSVTQAQGMFVAETIETGTSAVALAGEGIFAANTFSLNRDFADARNRTTPAETFVARPDFIMSSYKDADNNLWWFFQKWQEIAP